MEGRILDKRKVREKDSDMESQNDSQNKNPTKRPRVEYVSSSPKEKSPSPAAAQKSPVKVMTDNLGATAPTLSDCNNGDVGVAGSSTNNNDNAAVISKFDLPSPLTTQELEQKIGATEEEHDSDGESMKFLSGLIKSEEDKKKRQGKGTSTSADTGVNGTSPISKRSTGTGTMTNSKGNGRAAQQPNMTSSPLSLSDVVVVGCPASGCSQTLSGYLGDISSSEFSLSSSGSGSNSSRWTMSSLGSTIPRQSIVSIATTSDASEGTDDDNMRRPTRPAPVSKARKRSDGPIMSSTKIDEDSSDSSLQLDRMNVSVGIISNGEEYSSSGKSQPNSQPKKAKNAPSKLMDADEGMGASISRSFNSPRTGVKGAAKSDTPGTNGKDSAKKPSARRRGSSNFPIPEVPVAALTVLSTPPPARNVARIEGTSAKPLSRFEQEMNNEPIIISELQSSETLWSTILPEELVFARWRDKNYYSGMVKSKGLNDTWVIDYDDGMNDVASETHIIPVRILGVGVTGIYSPDDHYEAKPAEIIGQKFQKDPETEQTTVKYAIKCAGDDRPIWCSRRQLSIKEADAKKLRPEYASIVAGKPGDVSTDNIVCGPRRRTRGGTSEGLPQKQKRVVAGAFDESSTDAKLLEQAASTPKSAKSGKKAPATTKRKRGETSTPQASQTKEEPTPTKPPPAKVAPAIEFGKKRPKKILFQGMQFLLTASGGGDTDNPAQPAIPYDKDEYREMIESAGGEILETVGSDMEHKENVFLISDSYARTVKYIYCLASSIPCVCHAWIKQCLDTLEIVDWAVFTLPAGWSLEHQDLVQHHTKKPLKGCKVFVTSESDQLYNYWKPVLTAAEAVMLKLPKKKGIIIPVGTEVIVTDQQESESIRIMVREAEDQNIPVVKPEWLVQTIILGEKAHLYGSLKYTISANETEDDTDFSRTDDSAMESGTNDPKPEMVLEPMEQQVEVPEPE